MYRVVKSLDSPKIEKAPRELFLMPQQVSKILSVIKRDKEFPEAMLQRDHAIIFMAFHLGLRAGEVPLLMKRHFEDVLDGVAYIPTLKKSPRISAICKCGRRFRVSVKRMGMEWPCPRCGENVFIEVDEKKKNKPLNPEVEIPVPEEAVREYIDGYVASTPNEHLFVSLRNKNTKPLEVGTVQNIFSHWLLKAGLAPEYSFHALRHGRGVQLYEATQDLKVVQTCLRHESMSTSEIYVHLSPAKLSSLGAALGKKVAN